MKIKKRRVVNIDKKIFDTVKKYCDENSLNVAKWLEKIAMEKINMQKTDNIPWIPNGKMKDGTLIFGPCKQKPNVSGTIYELNINGDVVYVSLCCKKETLTNDEHQELVQIS